MLFFLGMVYVIGGIICSIVVIAACVLHSRASRKARKITLGHVRYQSFAERQPDAPHSAPDAEDTLVGHPA